MRLLKRGANRVRPAQLAAFFVAGRKRGRGPESATPPHDRDGVTKFQHRRKISSILIRNTVVPTAVRTTLGNCLAIEGVNHRKPGVVVSIIPMDVQRRCERRWAARFSRPTESVAPRNQRPRGRASRSPGPTRADRPGCRPLAVVTVVDAVLAGDYVSTNVPFCPSLMQENWTRLKGPGSVKRSLTPTKARIGRWSIIVSALLARSTA